MPALTLKALLGPRSGVMPVLTAIRENLAPDICIIDASGKNLLGNAAASEEQSERVPILHDGATLGYVLGSSVQASTLAALLTHLAARELEGRALASEVLHLYREIHLIEELSEQL